MAGHYVASWWGSNWEVTSSLLAPTPLAPGLLPTMFHPRMGSRGPWFFSPKHCLASFCSFLMEWEPGRPWLSPSRARSRRRCSRSERALKQGLGTCQPTKERTRGCGHSEEACCGKRGRQGSELRQGPQPPGTAPRPLRNRATQQEVSDG